MKQKKRLYRKETHVEPAVALQGTPLDSHTGHSKILSLVNMLAREKLDRLGDTGISSCKHDTWTLLRGSLQQQMAPEHQLPAARRRQEQASVQPRAQTLAYGWEMKTFPKLASSEKLVLNGIAVRSTIL